MRALPSSLFAALLASLAVGPAGCAEQLMLDGMIQNVRGTEGGIETVHDFDVARQMSESQLGLLEGLYRLEPADADVTYMLTRGWASLAHRFMLDAYEGALANGDVRRAVYERTRLRSAYRRARFYAGQWLTARDEGFVAASTETGALRDWLEDEVDDAEDAPFLVWAGLAWHGHARTVDAPDPRASAVGRALLERSIALDDAAEHGLAHVVLAAELATRKEAAARQHARRAVEVTHGSYLPALLARDVSEACLGGSRAVLHRRLDAIATIGDPMPAARLENLIATRRALRYRRVGAPFAECPLSMWKAAPRDSLGVKGRASP